MRKREVYFSIFGKAYDIVPPLFFLNNPISLEQSSVTDAKALQQIDAEIARQQRLLRIAEKNQKIVAVTTSIDYFSEKIECYKSAKKTLAVKDLQKAAKELHRTMSTIRHDLQLVNICVGNYHDFAKNQNLPEKVS